MALWGFCKSQIGVRFLVLALKEKDMLKEIKSKKNTVKSVKSFVQTVIDSCTQANWNCGRLAMHSALNREKVGFDSHRFH